MTAVRAPFRHVETWVFDLDNTLYPASCNLFAQIDERMTTYVSEFLSLSRDDARALQKSYYRSHGTTLNGLMAHNGADPQHYLAYVHDIDLSGVPPSPELSEALSRLPGRKIVYTNGPHRHAMRVIERLGVAAQFAAIYDITASGFDPKPSRGALEGFLGAHRIAGARAAMFDDIARNLVPAHEAGMTTIWMRNDSPWSKQGPDYPRAEQHHIHHEAEDLTLFLASLIEEKA
ncbi:MAG: pyrimidine 5'-nucleotidase [Alphaproteobacteria bacterium]|nr:pyrimidine 5'-nucleotidase [Alphaproteobacteria bacterium]